MSEIIYRGRRCLLRPQKRMKCLMKPLEAAKLREKFVKRSGKSSASLTLWHVPFINHLIKKQQRKSQTKEKVLLEIFWP